MNNKDLKPWMVIEGTISGNLYKISQELTIATLFKRGPKSEAILGDYDVSRLNLDLAEPKNMEIKIKIGELV